MLARYGAAQYEHVHLWKPDDENTSNIITLTRILSTLEKDRLRENNRLEASEITDAHNRVLLSITRMIKIIEDEIQEIENEIDTITSAYPTMKKNHDLLMIVISIGNVSRVSLFIFS